VRASGKCMIPVNNRLQVTIGARSHSGVHRVMKVSLQLGREQMRICPQADGNPVSNYCTGSICMSQNVTRGSRFKVL
jgi:hypothetical protein